MNRLVLLSCLLAIGIGLAQAGQFNRTKYAGPPGSPKRSLLEVGAAGAQWSITVGCSMTPDEVDRIIDTFFQAASMAQSASAASDPGAFPCWVSKVTGNVARTFITLDCYSASSVNVTRMDTFLRTHETIPFECRNKVSLDVIPLLHIKTTQATPGTTRWHLDRLDQRGLPLSHSYTYTYTGTGVSVYILDTGVWCSHNELNGRCSSIANFYESEPDVDGNGHGTHVAGLCCGATFGPAKGALIKSCRCLGNGGSGSFGDVMDCLMLIEDLFVASPHMAVVSMSLSGPIYSPVNSLVNTLAITHGIPVVVAAGNSGSNTNNYSPGSASGSTPVAASTIGDFMPSWSNSGGNTKIAAPGDGITSALTGTASGSTVKSGTSMSCPIVSGVHALMFELMFDQNNQTEIPFGLDVTTAVIAMASQSRINGYPLVFTSIGSGDVPQLPATPPQQPSSAALSKPLNGLPPQPHGYLRSSAIPRVFMWFASSPLLICFLGLAL